MPRYYNYEKIIAALECDVTMFNHEIKYPKIVMFDTQSQRKKLDPPSD